MKRIKNFCKGREWKIVAVFALIVYTTLVFASGAISNVNNAATFNEHLARQDCITWGTQSISAEATASVTTACGVVESCIVTVDTEAATTAAHLGICTIPTQTGTTKSTVIITANNVGATASGTTKLNYVVTGYGRR